jgi:hypothetical protein
MGDALQWVGVVSIIAVCAAIISVGGRSSTGAATPAVSSLQS